MLAVPVALAAAVAPLPAAWIERVYSRGSIPAFSPIVTPVSTLMPIALLDVAVAAPARHRARALIRRARTHGARAACIRALAAAP